MLDDIEQLTQDYLPSKTNLITLNDSTIEYSLGLAGVIIDYDDNDIELEAYLVGLIEGKHYYLMSYYMQNVEGYFGAFYYECPNYDNKNEMDFLEYAVKYLHIKDLLEMQMCIRSKRLFMAVNNQIVKLAHREGFDYP